MYVIQCSLSGRQYSEYSAVQYKSTRYEHIDVGRMTRVDQVLYSSDWYTAYLYQVQVQVEYKYCVPGAA